MTGEGFSSPDYDRRRIPPEESLGDLSDPIVEARLSEIEEGLSEIPKDPEMAARLSRTSVILQETVGLLESAQRRYHNIGGLQYTIEDGLRSDGRVEPGEFHVLLITEDGLTPPLGDPDTKEHLIIRFRVEDVVNNEALDCWLEHHIPAKTSSDVAQVARWRVGMSFLERWNAESPNEPFEEPFSEEGRDILYQLAVRVSNWQLAQQRSGLILASESATIDADVSDMGFENDEGPELGGLEDMEISPSRIWGQFFNVFAGIYDKALESLPIDARDFSNHPHYNVHIIRGERDEVLDVSIRIFLTDKESAERIRQTKDANSSTGLLVSMPISELSDYVVKFERKRLQDLPPARERLSLEIQKVLQQHFIIEYLDGQGNLSQEWDIYPSRVEIATPMGDKRPFEHTIERKSDNQAIANGRVAPYTEMLRHIITLTRGTVLSPIVPHDKPYRPRVKS